MIKYIYIRFTDYCNVGCTHCYITGKRRRDFSFLSKKKIDIIYDKLIQEINKKRIYNYPIIRIYGGEILLIEYEILNYFFKKFKNFNIEIQTSFVPLFDKNYEERKIYYNLFLNDNIKLSTSYDFFGVRKYKGSEKLYLEKLIEIVTELNKLNKFPVLLITITKLFYKQEKTVFDILFNIRKIFSKIQYNIYTDYGFKNLKLSLSNKEAAEILIKLYNLDKEKNFVVFDNFLFLNEAIKKNYRNFSDYETNCQATVLTIEENGNLGNCPKRIDNYTTIKNIENFYNNKKRLEWIIEQKKTLQICKTCEFKNICNGGCPLKKKEFGYFNKDKENCPGFYPLLKHIKNNL